VIILWCLFCLCFGVMGGACAGVILLRLLRGNRSKSWPTVTGIIEYSRIREWFEDGMQGPELYTRGSTQYEADIIYGYEINDLKYNAKRINTSFRGENRGLKCSRSLSERYPSGKPIQVYYDPNNPRISVLEPGFILNSHFFGYCFGIVLSLGFTVLFTIPDWNPEVPFSLVGLSYCLGLAVGYLIIRIIDNNDHGYVVPERNEIDEEWEEESQEQYLRFKEKTLQLCTYLSELGINSCLSETEDWIEISDSPIRGLSVIGFANSPGKHETIYINVFIPDSRSLPFLEVQVKSARRKLFNKVGRLRWKGDMRGCSFDKDERLNTLITKENAEITIGASYFNPFFPHRERAWFISPIRIADLSLTKEQWSNYENMAKRLLEIPLDFG
jgi:hypothetical protein